MRVITALIVLLLALLPASAQTPDSPRFTLSDGVIYGDAGAGSFPLASVEGVVFTKLFRLDSEPPAAVALGHIDDGTDNIVIGWPFYANGELLLSMWVIDGASRGKTVLKAEERLSYRTADGSIAFSAVIPSDDPDHAYIYRLTHHNLERISAPLAFAVGEDGEWVLPEPTDYRSYIGEPTTVIVRSIEGLSLTFTEGGLIHFESPNDSPEVEFAFRDFSTDAPGMYGYVDGVEIRLPFEGSPYFSLKIDETKTLYVSADWGSPEDDYHRVDRLYMFDIPKLRFVELFETDDIVLEGPVAMTPDRKTILFSAYSDRTGAAIWRLELAESGSTTGEPVMLVGGLMFWADAGNFILPTFTEVTAETFTISTFGLDWSGEEPRELGELLTYSLDGELLGTAPKPTPEP